MKHFKSIILCALACVTLGLTSCNDWLDINTDPNTPSAESTPYQLRLAHILFYSSPIAVTSSLHGVLTSLVVTGHVPRAMLVLNTSFRSGTPWMV